MSKAPEPEIVARMELIERIKQMKAERKRYLDVEGDGVDVLLNDLWDYLETPRAGAKPMNVRPMFAWYDLWVGVFVDRQKRRLYVFPVPCLGVVIEWGINR